MTEKHQVLGLDMGGTYIRIGMVDAAGKLSQFEINASQEALGTDTSKGLVRFIKEYMARKHPAQLPAAVSLGMPSTISRDRRRVLSTPNISGLDNLPIVDILEDAFCIPAFLDRDVNMLFECDSLMHHIPDQGVSLGFYIGTGFGNVIAIDGKVYTGKNGVAGELGHIPIRGVTDICGCGNIGCAEVVASGKRLQEICKQYFPQTPIANIFEMHSNSPEIEAFLDDLSLPIATEITILDPECALIGGGVVQMAGFPRERLEYYIHQHARKSCSTSNFHIIYSQLHQENGVIGAGIHGHKKLKELQR